MNKIYLKRNCDNFTIEHLIYNGCNNIGYFKHKIILREHFTFSYI